MAKIIGKVVRLNNLDTVYNASNATVAVHHGGKLLATAIVDRDEQFELELPPDTTGEVTVSVDLPHAAPVTSTADGEDLMVTVLYNNQQYYA